MLRTIYKIVALRILVDRERIELSISGCKPDVFPLALTAQNTGLRCKNRTCAPWSQTKSDTISPIGVELNLLK